MSHRCSGKITGSLRFLAIVIISSGYLNVDKAIGGFTCACPGKSSPEVTFRAFWTGGPATQKFAFSYSFILATEPGPFADICSIALGSGVSSFDGPTDASFGWRCVDCVGAGLGPAAGTIARTFPPVPGGVVIESGNGTISCPGSIAVATTSFNYVVNTDTAWSADLEGAFPASSVDTDPAGIWRGGVVFGESFYGTFVKAGCTRQVGVVFDSVADEYVFSDTLSGPAGNVDLSGRAYDFDDGDYDVNKDGRFNTLDVDALRDLFGPVTSETERWDLFDDGASADVIDEADADELEALIAAGLDSGIFGDGDSDGDVDCADYGLLQSLLGKTLCDPEYLISLDWDLDGDIDAADDAALDAITKPQGDVDGDDFVGSMDLALVQGAWGTDDEAADLNGDGVVGSADLGLVLGDWNSTCP